ncbi:transporter substrate-binding domain-containing protein [Solirubrobacter ginsenosidimutans]|uniref:Transporter substrate-binding domain-containing protein n=1 Tax=Solirubrobacter ginsenosidimutans TaxID=490573 RepID=A0A9X3S2L4_9ACTN|nr:transporter substrate-binding domain-containing protein [Solirubrobacter ginsenosidimutans]MDA0158728.1 transporter substrate-binding domain-containing protein [Solirubrobacter ginsenosidimutans]
MLGACGGDGSHPASTGNAANGDFDPPPIQTRFPEAVTRACNAQSPTLDRIKDEGTLFWAIGATPRFGFKLRDGRWAGVEAQNAAELATLLGVDYDITEYTYDVLARTLITGQADIIGAQLFVTRERAKLIDFSTPYYRAGQLFYVPRDSPYQTIADLNRPSVRFVAGFGTAQLGLAKKYLPRARINGERLTGQLILYEPIAAGRAEATMTDASAMQIIRDEFKHPPLVAVGLNGRVTGRRVSADEMLDPFDVAFGLSKGDPAWKACVDAWVRDLLDSGRMEKRLDYWLAQRVT